MVKKGNTKEDPALSSFMSFLAGDMLLSPDRITPLNARVMERVRKLVGDVEASPEENFGDEPLI